MAAAIAEKANPTVLDILAAKRIAAEIETQDRATADMSGAA
jgi:hypothetical protein